MELLTNCEEKVKRKTNQLMKEPISTEEIERLAKDPTMYDEQRLIDTWRKYIY